MSPSASRRQPQDRGYQERREMVARRLLPAVEQLLEERTYPELTIDEMVLAAGVSRSTFYNYFADKGDLLRVLTADVMSALIDATRVWWRLSPKAERSELRKSLDHLVEIYRPHAAMMRAVVETVELDPRVREEFLVFMNVGAQGIADYIRDGQAAGALRPGLDADRAGAWLVWGLERGLSQFGREQDPDRLMDAFADILWSALR